MADKQFKYIVPGIDGGGAQVFEADTQEELIEKLGEAQKNATGKIRELAQQNETIAQHIQQAQPQGQNNGDARQEYFNTLYQDPMKAHDMYFEQRFGMKPDEFIQEYQQVRAGSQTAIQNQVASQFAQKHPELLQVSQEDDKHNSTEISKILTENGWAFNERNLEAAYALAKQEGKIKLNQSSPFPEATLPSVPSTISRPTGAVNTSASEEEFLRTGPLDKVKKYLEEKYAGSRG